MLLGRSGILQWYLVCDDDDVVQALIELVDDVAARRRHKKLRVEKAGWDSKLLQE